MWHEFGIRKLAYESELFHRVKTKLEYYCVGEKRCLYFNIKDIYKI